MMWSKNKNWVAALATTLIIGVACNHGGNENSSREEEVGQGSFATEVKKMMLNLESNKQKKTAVVDRTMDNLDQLARCMEDSTEFFISFGGLSGLYECDTTSVALLSTVGRRTAKYACEGSLKNVLDITKKTEDLMSEMKVKEQQCQAIGVILTELKRTVRNVKVGEEKEKSAEESRKQLNKEDEELNKEKEKVEDLADNYHDLQLESIIDSSKKEEAKKAKEKAKEANRKYGKKIREYNSKVSKYQNKYKKYDVSVRVDESVVI